MELKGDRRSIGGSQMVENKEFTLYEFKISPGDMIYLFSDGMTDQFGGVEGKKLKRSGLFNWIKEHAHLDMTANGRISKTNSKLERIERTDR
ncbi:MAG: SpoIIE family protein phosphatase [Flavobacteriales bacterium]|nr:SpoIIE family protein phosphatase [Flavobacteriales bacterium]